MHTLFKEKITGIFNHTKFFETFNRENIKTTQIDSKPIVMKLLKFSPTFRTEPFNDGTFPDSKIPDFFNNLKPEEIKQILKVMFSTDGSVVLSVKWHKKKKTWRFSRSIKLSCKHPLIKQKLTELLNRIGFQPRTDKEEIVLERKKDIQKFQSEIGFVDGVKVTKNSKFWFGLEKNKLLELAVKTLPISEVSLRKFKTKEEVLNFLKSLI